MRGEQTRLDRAVAETRAKIAASRPKADAEAASEEERRRGDGRGDPSAAGAAPEAGPRLAVQDQG